MQNSAPTGDRAGKRTRVFISYGHSDAEALALRLERDLVSAEFEVWLDRSNMRAGRSWEEQIQREILSSQVFLSLLTPHAVRRPNGVCLDEISFARYNGRRIVPLMVKPCQPPLGIYRLDWIDFLSWEDEARYAQGLRRLTQAIASDGDRVEGGHARLLGALRPLDFGIEVSRLTRHFTGREWLFTEIDTWLATDTSRLFLITGDPGSGKSAAMAKLIERHPAVAACHFCVSSISDSLNPFRFACSIAAQLATQLDDYRMALDAVDLEGIQAMDASTLWRRVIVDPLSSLILGDPILIVVDALDEGMRVEGRSIPKLLSEQADALPANVRMVVSTRKEPEILDRFSGFLPHEIGSSSGRNQADVAAYIEHCLGAPRLSALIAERRADFANIRAVLAARAEGNFLYVVQAAAAMESGLLDPLHPEHFPEGLVGIYQAFFERLFSGGESFKAFRRLLEVLCAAREPIGSAQIAGFLEQDRLDVETDLDRVAVFFPESQGRYRPYHKTIVEWLAGAAGHSGRFRVDVQRGHWIIGESLLRDYRSGKVERYTLANLPAHLRYGGNMDALQALLGKAAFVVAKTAAGMFQAAIGDYELSDAMDFQILREALILSAHVAGSHSEQLPAQLLGRLGGFSNKDVVEFVRSIEPYRGLSLLPTTASLTAPGGPLLRVILGSPGEVKCVVFGKLRSRTVIISCCWGDDKAVRLWDLETGDPISEPLTGHTKVINGVAFGHLADGTAVIASGGNDATVRLWEAETGQLLGDPFNCLKGPVHGVTFVDFKGRPVIFAASAYGSTLLDLDSRLACTGRTYPGYVAVYATLADGKPVIISNSRYHDNSIFIRDADNGRRLGAPLVGHRLSVSALAIGKMPNGEQILASGSFDATVRLWRLDSGKQIAELRGHADQYTEDWTTLYANRAINDLAFCELGGVPGLVSASGDATLRVWNLETLDEFGPPLRNHNYGVNSVTCGRLGDIDVVVSGGDDRTIRVWRPMQSPYLATRANRHEGAVTAIATTRILDKPVILTGSDDTSVRLTSADSGQFIGLPFEGHKATIRTVAIGKILDDIPVVASGSADGTIRIWNLLTSELIGRPIITDAGEVWSVKVIEVGRRVIIAATVDYRNPWVHFWDLATGRRIGSLDTGHRDSVPAITSGTIRGSAVLVTAGQDDTLRIWDLETMQPIAEPMVGHTGWTMMWQTADLADSIAFGELDDATPMILCPHVDHTIRVVAADNGKEVLAPLAGHREGVSAVRFGRLNGKRACVSAGYDRSVRVWDLTSGQQLATFIADAPVLCCDIDPFGHAVVAGDQSGAIHVLKLVSASRRLE